MTKAEATQIAHSMGVTKKNLQEIVARIEHDMMDREGYRENSIERLGNCIERVELLQKMALAEIE